MRKMIVVLFSIMAIIQMISFDLSNIVYANSDISEDVNLTETAEKAYIFTLPLYIMYRTRWKIGGVNEFRHRRRLTDPNSRAVTSPNNDTLNSSAWLDLESDPLVLHVPDTSGRYYSLQFLDFYTNTFAYIGQRTTGTRVGDYLVVGPANEGEIPPDLPIIKSPTNEVWLISRFLIDGPEDLSSVHALQNQLSITPLSSWMDRESVNTRDKPTKALILPNPEDPWNYFKIVNLVLTKNPPPASEKAYIEEFKRIGIGPGLIFDPNRFSEKQREEILEGIKQGKDRLKSISKKKPRGRNGWTVPNLLIGNYGTNYILRAIVAVVGLGAHTREEAMYFRAIPEREPFHGRNRYVLHFEKDGFPPVDAFWSLTMYRVEKDMRSFLIENPINRYSVGDRTKGLKYNSDGSLDIYIQYNSPGSDKESNWLPAPDGKFRVVLRAYQPRKQLLEGRYLIPKIRCIE